IFLTDWPVANPQVLTLVGKVIERVAISVNNRSTAVIVQIDLVQRNPVALVHSPAQLSSVTGIWASGCAVKHTAACGPRIVLLQFFCTVTRGACVGFRHRLLMISFKRLKLPQYTFVPFS